MRTTGAKALIKVANGERLIARQVRLIHEMFANPQVYVVTGFESHRFPKYVDEVTFIENESYENINVAHSIMLGLQAAEPPCVIVYGDLVFQAAALGFDLTGNGVLVDPETTRRVGEVGVTLSGNTVAHFSYGLWPIWSHIAWLDQDGKDAFLEAMKSPLRSKYLAYEIFNHMLDMGISFRAETRQGLALEIDENNDIEPARRIP